MTSPCSFRTAIFAFLIALAAPVVAQSPNASGQHWVATWGTAQTPARIPVSAARATQPAPAAPAAVMNPAAPVIPVAPAMLPPSQTVQRRYNLPPAASNFNNQTVRMSLRTTIGGDTVRIRLFNTVGAPTITLGTAHIALHAKDSAIVAGSDRSLTFGGRTSATIYGGQVLISDPVKLSVAPLADLSVSLYFPGETGLPTNHPLGLRPAYTSTAGDFTGAPEIASPASVSEAYYFLDGVDVLAPSDAAALVTFGDSITDGDQSTPGADAMWPAILAQRLLENKSTAHVAVVNEGISGNRILGDNVSGLSRWTHQALDVPGVKWVTVLEGINDINGAMRAASTPPPPGAPAPAPFSADDLIAAYRQMIDTAHERGVKVIGCTITPYGGSSGYKDAGEAIREAANDWIRAKGHFDAVVDFDAATRDSADPKRFSAAAESPDLLHPGDAGYKMMANAFNLAVFAPQATASASASSSSTSNKSKN
jgi:lysophospholipase L1-like esterase